MRYWILLLLLSCSLSTALRADGIEFFQGTWDEALAFAESEGKIIFVDAYTVWCGPCKRMAKNVFPLPEVGEYYNAHMVSVKLDMDKAPGKKWRQKYPVSAYPTLYYISPEGEVLLKVKGAKQAADFLKLGKTAVSKYDGSASYKKKYDAGDRSYETIYNYVRTLNKANKSSLKIANDYLKTQNDLTTPENLRFLLEAAVQADSRIFTMMEEHKSALIKLVGKESYEEHVEKACIKTVQRAIDYETPSLIADAEAAMKRNIPDKAQAFSTKSHMEYAREMNDEEVYLKNTKVYYKKYAQESPKLMSTLAKEIMEEFPSNKELMGIAEKSAAGALDKDESLTNYYVYATVMHRNGKNEKAVAVLEKGIKFGRENSQNTKILETLKSKIQNT